MTQNEYGQKGSQQIPTNWIQQHNKIIVQHDQVKITLGI